MVFDNFETFNINATAHEEEEAKDIYQGIDALREYDSGSELEEYDYTYN